MVSIPNDALSTSTQVAEVVVAKVAEVVVAKVAEVVGLRPETPQEPPLDEQFEVIVDAAAAELDEKDHSRIPLKDEELPNCEEFPNKTERTKVELTREKKKRRMSKQESLSVLSPPKRKRVEREQEEVVDEVIEDIWFVTVSHIKREYVMRFLVKWDGFPPSENTYEPFEHVAHAEVLQEFVKRKFEAHQERIDAAISSHIMESMELYGKYLTKTKSFIMAKLDRLNILQYKCSMLAFIYTYAKIPTSSEFIRKLRYHSILYKFHLRIEKQNEDNFAAAKKIMKKEKKAFQILVENQVDFDVLPTFQYLKTVENPFKVNLSFGCKCKTCTKDSGCCPQFLGSDFVYDVDHRICALSHQMIVECNDYCSCDSSCINRPKKANIPFKVFKTENRGWSLKTLTAIPAGTFVIEYTGELIDQNEAKKRLQIYSKTGVTYLFDLDYNESGEATYSIDATNKGNLSRFINHSCEANLQTWPATSCNEKRQMHRLYYFSLRNIRAGEELTVDYSGGTLHQGSPIVRPKAAIACKCGAATCKGFTF